MNKSMNFNIIELISDKKIATARNRAWVLRATI